MAADLYRVVRTRVGRNGNVGTVASEPLTRDEAMRRFTDCVTLGWDRLRVLNERDYTPSELGPQDYSGEAAHALAPVHYGNRLTPTACDLAADQVPFLDGVTLRSSLVTCERCLTALTTTRRGPVHLGRSQFPPETACGESMNRLPLTDTWACALRDVTCAACLDAITASP